MHGKYQARNGPFVDVVLLLSREPNIFIDADLRISVFSHQVLTPMSSAAAAAQQANVVDGTQRIDTTEQK